MLPTVMYGGLTILTMMIRDPQYMANPLRQDLWRAGHAHAGILLILSLIVLRYVDEANLSGGLQALVRISIPLAAILMPAGFLLSMMSPAAAAPSPLISLTYVGLAGAQYFGRGTEGGIARAGREAVYWYVSIPARQVGDSRDAERIAQRAVAQFDQRSGQSYLPPTPRT